VIGSLNNIRVESDLFFEFDCTRRIKCIAKCFANIQCTSFSFNKETSKCRNYNVEAGKGTYSGNLENGWRYYLVAESK